jgi:hypothetical protein
MDEKTTKDEDIRQILEKNLRLTEEIFEMTKKIKNFIVFQKIMSMIYFLIIVVPLILSLIYLPPILKDMFSQYQNILDQGQESLHNQ